ncbi:MAG: hypothetical protein AAFO06_24745 [Cyanobacteria bacterium J06597_16]
MPFTIRPDAAQAMQEDEAQLVSAIAQVAQRVPAVLKVAENQSPSDSLRIKMGRRLVYGQLADGPFRHELDANSLKVISDALQRPVTPGVNPEKYAHKVPAIEIFQGNVLLFREERDGTITTNEIQFQVEEKNQTRPERQKASAQKNTSQPAQSQQNQTQTNQTQTNQTQTNQPAVPVSVVAQAENTDSKLDPKSDFTVNKAEQLLRTSEYLINPLRQEKGMYDAVSVNGYQIKQSNQHVTVSQGDRLILVARGGEVMSDQVTDQDWDAFSQIQIPNQLSQPVLETESQPKIETPQPEVALPTSPHEANGAVPKNAEIVGDSEQVVKATNQQPAALSVLERETQKLPESPTRKLLQATIQDWKRQIGQWLSTKLQKGLNWLKAQQTTLQNQRLASAVQRLFQRGHERTGEHSYQVSGCNITREGQNLYMLKDAVGELMKFKASNLLGLGRRTEVLSVSDRLTSQQRQGLLSAEANLSVAPQSSLDVEAAYAQKTRQVENTTRKFLKNFAFAKIWSKEGGQFKLEIGEGDLLRITDKKNGRGVVFQREKGEVFSKLGNQDFEHFERLASKMQGMAPRQNQTATNNSKKVTAIEMD